MKDIDERRIEVGDRIQVLVAGQEVEDDVIEVVGGTARSGLWMVETRKHGRVIVMPGREGRWVSDRR